MVKKTDVYCEFCLERVWGKGHTVKDTGARYCDVVCWEADCMFRFIWSDRQIALRQTVGYVL